MREKKIYLSNAFSINMISHLIPFNNRIYMTFKKLTIDEVKEILSKNNFISAIGHESTALFLSRILDLNIPVNRIAIKLEWGDKLIVLILNKRLPEGQILSLEELEEYKKDMEFVLVEFPDIIAYNQ
ncbi:MAG: STIV orfB116 family protein [Candidatus Nanopusillus sp.]|jgi:hypothetical protein